MHYDNLCRYNYLSMNRKHMAFHSLIMVSLLLGCIHCVERIKVMPQSINLKVDAVMTASDSMAIQTINILMENKQIQNNNQYQNCFTE